MAESIKYLTAFIQYEMNANQNAAIIQALRNQVQGLTQERQNIRQELNDVNAENRNFLAITRNLRNRVQQLERQNNDLEDEKDELNREKELLNQRLNSYKPKIFPNNWKDVSRQTKRKRKADYTDILDKAIRNIPECKKAKVTLRLGEENVNFKWQINDMQQHRDALRRQGFNINNPIIVSDDEKTDSEKTQNVADRKKTKRKVVAMMDKFKLSQKGYHEFRMMFASNIPPINQIKQERFNYEWRHSIH